MLLKNLAVCSLVVGLWLGSSGCKDEDDSSAGDGPFLSAGDLGPGAKLKTVSETEALSTLKAESFVYDNQPDDKTKSSLQLFLAVAAEDQGKCLDQKFDEIVAEGDASTLIFRGSFDASRCLDSTENQGLAFATSMGLFIQFTCDSADLSAYVGKSFGELSAGGPKFLPDQVCNTATFLVNTQADVSVSGKYTEDGKSQDVNFKSVTYSYVGDGAGNPCTRTTAGEEVTYVDGCLSIDKDVTLLDQADGKPSEDEGAESYERYEMAGIKASAKGDKAFFSAGKIKAQINAWVGELAYSGSDTPPLYSLNNGTKLLEGALGVYGNGGVRFGEMKTMALGSCGAFSLELRSGGTLVPAKADIAIAVTSPDGKLFTDAECKTAATTVTIVKATSSVALFAQPKDADTTDFMIQGVVKTTGYETTTMAYVELTGFDDGFLQFVDATAIRIGECKEMKIVHFDDKPATADIAIALASDDADFYSDAACTSAATSVTFKNGTPNAVFYLKAHTDANAVIVDATPAKPSPAISSTILDVDQEKVTFSGPDPVVRNTCNAFTLTHGFDAGDEAVKANLVIAVESVLADFYSDAGCVTAVTEVTIPSGQDHVEFYVKSAAGTAVLTADPAGDSMQTALESVVVSM